LGGQYKLVAVADRIEQRRAEATAARGCRAYGDVAALARDEEVEMLVVATPNFLHTPHAVEALDAGKHVVCEKPFALSVEDADRMIGAARRAGRVLAPFQNRRYEESFQRVKQIIASGRLGRIVHIRIAMHAFGRRWDWQTLRKYGGGQLYNNGPHLLDQALELFGPAEPDVFADLQNALSSGDAEDHVKVALRGNGSPTVEIELTSACAYPQDKWLVMGAAGSLRGSTRRLEWKWVDWGRMPGRPVDEQSTPDRSYNREELQWQQESCDCTDDIGRAQEQFYQDLYQTLREGKPLVITPESVRRQVAVMEKCRRIP
jgi:predicted dehydrogenase